MTTHPYLLTVRAGAAKLHRSTCKKATVNPTAEPTSDWSAGSPATCCKPRQVEQPAPDPAPVPEYDPHPVRRGELATEEARALRKAKRDRTTPPPTPNLDKVNEEYAQGIDHHARLAMGAAYDAEHGGADGKTTRRAKIPVAVRFMRSSATGDDLKPMPDSQNKLASVAYYHTAGINGDDPRIPTDQLRQWLADHDVPDPEGTPWGPLTLPNGVMLQAVTL